MSVCKYLGMHNLYKNFDKLRKDVSDLIKNEGYDQILDRLDSFLDSNTILTGQTKDKDLLIDPEMFKSFLDINTSGVSILTPNKILYVNKAWCDLTGYSKAEAKKVNPLDILHPDSKDLVLQRFRAKVRREDVPTRFEIQILTKKGEIKWIDFVFSIITFEGEIASIAILNDITSVISAQDALKSSEQKFKELTELSPAAISINTLDRFLVTNPAWCNIMGYSEAEALNLNPMDLVPPDMEKEVEQRIEKRLNGDKSIDRYDLKIITKQGKIKWLNISLAPVIYEGQRAELGVAIDITNEKLAQQALKESEKKYKSLIENLRQEYFFYRFNTEGEYMYVSPSIEYIMGYKPTDIRTHYNKHLTDNPINQDAKQRVELAMQGIQQLPYEIEMFDIQQNRHMLEVTEAPIIDNEGNVISVEGIIRDITSQKIAEEKLKESEKQLKILNDQKDKFFSLLAHDLRGPVGNFVQIAELLKTNYESLSTEEVFQFFNSLHSIADSTYKLLDNLLTWSRSQLDKLEIKIVEIKLFDLVNDVVFLFEENLKAKNIHFINELPRNLVVNADYNILQTLFRNLISNAIKFSYPEGHIRIKHKKEIDKQTNKEYFIISLEDNGVGIPEDKIDKIFSFEEHYTTLGTDKEKGTGLGLNLCKELIEKMGEKIWLGSQEGKGTTFYFTLRR